MTNQIVKAAAGIVSLPHNIKSVSEAVSILEEKNASREAVLSVSEQRISQCQDDKIKQLIAVIGITAGINVPSQTEVIVIIDWFRRKLAGYSLEEIKHAFELYAENLLVVKFEHYGKFSVRFIMAVIEGYRSRRGKGMKEAYKLLEPAEKPIKHINPSLVFIDLVRYIKNCNSLPIMAPWQELYDYLIKIGTLKDSDHDRLKPIAEQRIKNNALKSDHFSNYMRFNGKPDNVETFAIKLCVLEVLSTYLRPSE